MKFIFSTIIVLVFFVIGCNSAKNEDSNSSKDDQLVKAAKQKEKIPILSPEESLKQIIIPDSFKISLVAHEPLVTSPITFTFDDNFRMWVLEMNSFQPIMDKSTGPLPMGKIVILEDTNGDGMMDKETVFLDSLRVPRAIYLDDEGVLYATPPNLWYVYRNGDVPGKKILIDSNYTITNNTEGQTNGLYRSMDNWIYNAGFGSSKRYKKIEGKWITDSTINRGQWGLSQDDFGRLFYNNNSNQLIGDYFMPGLVYRDHAQNKIAGFNETIVKNQKVYPAKKTFAANNAFREGELGDDLKLARFTAASGPVIYRGGILGEDFDSNAFVAEPVGHLVKRNRLQYTGNKIEGFQVYEDKEFISSKDERFRPVTIKNGPDGAIYIVDMYRGVIQDSMWVSPYLREYSINHDLVDPINLGRIYKVTLKGSYKNYGINKIPKKTNQLIELLGSENGWLRDRAQKKLVGKKDLSVVESLRKVIHNNGEPLLKRIHAMWTLEGLNSITASDLSRLINDKNEEIRKQTINIASEIVNKRNYKDFLPFLKKFATDNNDSLLVPNLIYLSNRFRDLSPQLTKQIYEDNLKKYPDNPYVVDAVLNGMKGKEMVFSYLKKYSPLFDEHLEVILKNLKGNTDAKDVYKKGFDLYTTYCATCHGENGRGIESVAPPLDNSEIVNGPLKIPIAIMLNGLEGEITVNGKKYDKTNVGADMPSFKDKLNDGEVAQILNYIRHAWSNNSGKVTSNDASTVRYLTIDRKVNSAFKIDEVNKLFGE